MNTFSAIVVDDEPLIRKGLELMLRADPEVRVVASCSNGRIAVDRIRELRPDVAFLDVQMPHLDGFDVLQELDPAERPQVVFVSGREQHAVRAFEVSAVDYLLKPFNQGRFATALGRAKAAVRKLRAGLLTQQVEQLLQYAKELDATAHPKVPAEVSPGSAEQLVLKAGGALVFMKPADVVWIEAQGDFVKVQAGSKAQLVRETLQNLELKLDSSKFLRIHRSFLVNLDHVARVETAH
jgi:two-component system, LytTR family, response regulator